MDEDPDSTRVVQLTRGKYCVIDAADYDHVMTRGWCAARRKKDDTEYFYAVASSKVDKILMHRWLLSAKPDELVDHKNGDTLDNRRLNLRLCTKSQNAQNRHVVLAQSGFKGVIATKSGRWSAHITKNYRSRHIGTFDTKEEAALAYDAEAVRMFGEFANLNFPRGV